MNRLTCALGLLAAFVLTTGFGTALADSDSSSKLQSDEAIPGVIEPYRGLPYLFDWDPEDMAPAMPEKWWNVPPVMPPAGPRGVVLENPEETVVYNLVTGEVTYESGVRPWSAEFAPPPEPAKPVDDARRDAGEKERTPVEDTTVYPWRTHTKLLIDWPNGGGGGCSGAIIDGFHVLTAGHCIHQIEKGGWADAVSVWPGYNEYAPYGQAFATIMRTYTAWTENEEAGYDWALLTLDRNLGNFTGWMGREYHTDLNWYVGHPFQAAGYPGDISGGQRMYYYAGPGEIAWELMFAYTTDATPGTSGMPVWENESGPEYINGVNAYGHCGSYGTCGPRMNESKYNDLITWIAEDTPPVDKPDLLDFGNGQVFFSPHTVIPGVTGFSIDSRVRNYGTVTAPALYNVTYYASVDDVISPTDHLIGTNLMPTSLAPFGIDFSEWNGTFPTGIPAGTYIVGAIVDSGDVVDELIETNNTGIGQFTLAVETPDHTVSGRVTDSLDAGLSGIRLVGLPGTPVTDDEGDYSATVPHEWSGTVTPVGCYNFSPHHRDYTIILWDVSNQSFTGSPKDCSHLNDDCNNGVCDPADGLCKSDPKPDGTDCDNGNWCYVNDHCEGGLCIGDPRDCSDGIECTTDLCLDQAEICLHEAMDWVCDDGDVCTGVETCSLEAGCVAGTPLDCEDGNDCTFNWCQTGVGCRVTPLNGTPCDDGDFCTVNDTCSDGGCYVSDPRDCRDAVACTIDSCDEIADTCVNDPADDVCDDGLWCNGAEWCSADTGCNSGTPPCGTDGIFCNGTEYCNERADTCENTGNPCNTGYGEVCGGAYEACNESLRQCVTSFVECPDDGLWCNGDELCIPLIGICGHSTEIYGELCPDNGIFCDGEETCDETGDQCVSSGDPCEQGTCCEEEQDTCVTIAVTVNEPVASGQYPADRELAVSWTTAGEACMDSSDVSAQFTLDAESFDVLLMTGLSPSDSLIWNTPTVDWIDLEIRVKVSDPSDALTVEGTSGSFELYVPRAPSIAYDPALGEAALAWAGGISDVLILDGPFDPGFTGAATVPSVTSLWVDADAGTSAQRYYRILNAGTSAASPITLGKRDIEVWQGYNLLAVPLLYDDELLASEVTNDMIAQGGDVIELSKWISASATWVTYDPTWPVVDFEIRPGEGFFLKAGDGFTWSIAGEVMRSSTISIDTVYGYAMLGVPTWEYSMASDVAAAMIAQGGDPQEISRWLASAGIWQTHDLSWPLVDFAIDATDGYIVKAGADAPFVLNPMNVETTIISATEAQVTFNTDVSGVAFIKLGTNPATLDSLAADALYEGTDHVFTLTGLIPGQTYYFEILFLGQTVQDVDGPFAFEME